MRRVPALVLDERAPLPSRRRGAASSSSSTAARRAPTSPLQQSNYTTSSSRTSRPWSATSRRRCSASLEYPIVRAIRAEKGPEHPNTPSEAKRNSGSDRDLLAEASRVVLDPQEGPRRPRQRNGAQRGFGGAAPKETTRSQRASQRSRAGPDIAAPRETRKKTARKHLRAFCLH